MAEQKPRAPRARRKTTGAEGAEVAAVETTTKKRKTAVTPRRRRSIGPSHQPGDVAVRAYLLWEQGEPGDATDHWLRAEQELAAA